MDKKAQLTVFIILGIVVLFATGILVYVLTKAAVKPVEEVVVEIPEGAGPLYDYVADCVLRVAEDGIAILGLQGGYIYLPAKIDKTPASYIPADEFGTFKIPYWYYEKEDRTPSMVFVQSEIARYVAENLRQCADFSGFADFSVSELGSPSATVGLADKEVVVLVRWPLEMQRQDRTIPVEQFVARIPVRLKAILELASQIMAAENEQEFFEQKTIDLISANPDTPVEGFEFDCSKKRWNIAEIRSELQSVLHYNIPYVWVDNTAYPPFLEKRGVYEGLKKEAERMTRAYEACRDYECSKKVAEPRNVPADVYEFVKYRLDAGNAPTDLKVGFDYAEDWGMLLNIQPRDGNVLKANSAKGFQKYLGFLCINQWHFVYDIIYPVRATIRDDSAFNGRGYLFQFAFPVLINQNEGDRVNFGLRKFEPISFYPDACEIRSPFVVDIRATGIEEGVPFATELSGANITYRCFTQECELGTTRDDEGVYRLRTGLPEGCTNPTIIASKEGYLPNQAFLVGDRVDIPLTKLKKMNYEVYVHDYNSLTGEFGRANQSLKNDERVLITLSLLSQEFDQYLEFPSNTTEIELVDGTADYSIDIVLMFRENVIGGYRNEKLRIPFEAIDGKKVVEFHLFRYVPMPLAKEDQYKMTKVLYESNLSTLNPRFR